MRCYATRARARDIGVDTIVCAPEPDSVPILDKMVKEFETIRLAIHNHGPEDKKFPSPYDVMKLVDVFKSQNVAAFSLAGQSKWTSMMWLEYLLDRIGADRVFPTLPTALAAFRARDQTA